MKEKNTIEIHLSTIFLLFAIIIIAVMAYFIFKLSTEKQSVEEKANKLSYDIYSLENTLSDLKEKIDLISNTTNADITNNEISLDTQYNTDYGIKFSCPSSFVKLERSSLKEYSVETLEDNNSANSITIVKDYNSIDEEINNIKTLTYVDGSLFNTNIKEDGYITLNSGLTGYKMEMVSGGSNVIKFITQKNNNTFIFTFVMNENSEQYINLFNKIMNTISIN